VAAASTKRLFLIDAMGYIFRAFYVRMPQRFTNSAGVPTQVPFLFANMLRRLMKLESLPADYLCVVFDPPGRTFRDELFTAYKAQRPPMPDDLRVQVPFVRRMCEAMRLPLLEVPGYEADDVIGALARQGAGRGLDVVIITSDKDLLQLVGPRVRVLIPTKNDLLVDAARVVELLGVPPAQVPDVMALMGDSIDNIPGARGIGEVGARALIRRFGNVETALERAAEVEGKRYREALQNSRDLVLLSKKLATIAADAPVTLDPDALRVVEPDYPALRRLYSELGFHSLLKDLAAHADSPAAPPVQATALDAPAALREFLCAVPAQQEVALWLTFAPPSAQDVAQSEGFGSRVVALEVATPEPHRRDAENAETRRENMLRVATAWLDERGEMLAALNDWLRNAANPLIVHDPKLFALVLSDGSMRPSPVPSPQSSATRHEPRVTNHVPIRHATMLYSFLLRPTTAKHDLADVALRHLGAPPGDTPGERAAALCRLAPLLRAEVEKNELGRLYEEIDLPLAPVLARMERHGVRVDPAALREMSAAMEEELRGMEKRVYELAGHEFNVNSPAQLAEVLFDKLNLPQPRKYGKGKVRSTAADVLESLADKHPLPQAILDYREIAKLKSTYVDALPRLIHPHTGRLHTRLNQCGTATGRLASSDPNLQNIPVRTELGRKIRAAFAAEPGWLLLSADYSQIELRLLAHISGDPVLVESFQRGEDIHARTAQEIFGAGPLMQTAEHRRAAKAVNFGIIYGLSPFGLAQQLGIDQKEAAKFISAYFERYRGVKHWLDAHTAEVRHTGFTRTISGRTRPIPEINATQPNLRNAALRTALNTPFQGAAADLIKLAMIQIDRQLNPVTPASSPVGLPSPRAKMILQVHDELLFEVPAAELEALRALVKPAMENVYRLKVPLVADLKSGPNWRDLA